MGRQYLVAVAGMHEGFAGLRPLLRRDSGEAEPGGDGRMGTRSAARA